MSTRRTHLQITGRVQGVFYRESARREALRLGLAGWVRNRPDGSVEAVAEGAPDALDAFVAWCRQGPTQAHVQDVRVQEESPQGEPGPFRVEHSS
ncbi:acylphosphatase [Aggregicoccus sp. 17bor-14]|uniref:acylphosphatase n=1 Tax=Myxococcaceae TaxID=31 RepID=UPI00129CED8B|nr:MULTISPECIES: acylphosphatase [Myxococcaceae]MBF5044381.1 acylphosphatase [Simulacricoccus sp. 17bor-14]MRI90128.1 acylphosphatase [Aggregicoccus sp. 17bor-14]